MFRGHPYAVLPIAGKTGTAQGLGNLPWNDSSAFGAFSLSPRAEYKYAAFAYLEKSGYGSQAAAPVVKCLYIALAGKYRFDELNVAEQLNTNSNEEWIFEDWESTAVVKHRYLYFEEGNLIGGWFQGSGERLPTQSPSNPHSPKPRT